MTNESIEMRNVLDRLIEASKALEALEKSKKLKKEDWPAFLSRSQAQLLQLHGRLAYAFRKLRALGESCRKEVQERLEMLCFL